MNEELRIEVAKYLGWTDILNARFKSLIGVPPWYKGKNRAKNMDPLPRFEDDLNACHEFERTLGFHDAGKFGVFNPLAYAYWKELKNYEPDRLYASAEARCRALLKARQLQGEKE